MTISNPIAIAGIGSIDLSPLEDRLTALEAQARLPWLIKTANYAAQPGDRIVANGSAGGFTVTLPTASPGDEVHVLTLGTNAIAVDPGGANLNGALVPMQISADRQETHFIYIGAAGWVAAIAGSSGSTGGSTPSPSPTTTLVDYIALNLPGVPNAKRQTVADAATLAASGRGYSAQSVIDSIAACTLWYQYDASSCFQDLAASTNCAVNTPVASWVPWRGTGNLNQSEGSARPVFASDGITFNGNNRLIRSLVYGENNTVIVAGKRTGGEPQTCFVGGHSYDFDLRCDTFQLQSGNILAGAYSVGVGEKVILSGLRQSQASRSWKNSIASDLNTAGLQPVSGSNFYVGSRNDALIPLVGVIYSLFYAAYALPDSERSKVERFANAYNSMALL